MDLYDCEVFTAGFPRQPINTVSSLVFLLGAFVLWRRGRKLPAIALGTAGVGSILFHGAPSGVASLLHDVGVYALLALAAVEAWRRVSTGRWPVIALVVFGLGVGVWFWSRTGGPLCSPESLLQGHAVWHVLATVAVVALFRASDASAPGAPAG